MKLKNIKDYFFYLPIKIILLTEPIVFPTHNLVSPSLILVSPKHNKNTAFIILLKRKFLK